MLFIYALSLFVSVVFALKTGSSESTSGSVDIEQDSNEMSKSQDDDDSESFGKGGEFFDIESLLQKLKGHGFDESMMDMFSQFKGDEEEEKGGSRESGDL